MTCDELNCGYWWKDEGEKHPSCHCPEDLHPAPCEDNCDEPADIDDDTGYDPYFGCYTGDC